MKRFTTTTLMLLMFSISLFAAVFCVNDTSGVKARNAFDLSKSYTLPLVSSGWDGSNTGTSIGSNNFIGLAGTRKCSHRIKFTIETDGKLVSQSDPTKYREFSVSINAKYGTDSTGNGSTAPFQWYAEGEMKKQGQVYYAGHALNTTDYWPNTASTGSLTFYSPRTDGTTRQYTNSSNTSAQIWYFFFDMGIFMAPLTTESMKHLAENDDYMATITVSWECAEPGTACTTDGDHSGSKTFIIRGYYGDPGNATNDAAYIYVVPNNNSTSIDIQKLATSTLASEKTLNIGQLQVHTATRTTKYISSGEGQAYDWASNVMVWASPKSTPSIQDTSGFLLAQIRGNEIITIPYVVTIYDSTDTNKLATFDGKTYQRTATGYAVAGGNTLDLKSNGTVNTSYDRYGNIYGDLQFYGNIHIEVPNPPADLATNLEAYAGAYTSYIYFHIMTRV